MNKYVVIPILMALLLAGCSKSDDQREFENQALTIPDGITETNSQGDVIDRDRDDWRIGPMYRGLIELQSNIANLPHPNPVPFNQNLTIQIHFRVEDPVDAIEIRKFRLPSNFPGFQLRYLEQSELSFSYNITIQGSNIAEGASEDARTTYRLLIYDGNQNLISYGDVRIQ